MRSYLKYLFNPVSVNVDSGCCRNTNIFDYELLVQLLLSYYVQYRDHVTFLKVKINSKTYQAREFYLKYYGSVLAWERYQPVSQRGLSVEEGKRKTSVQRGALVVSSMFYLLNEIKICF